MKDETLKELNQANTVWSDTLRRAYGKWCSSVLSTLYTELEEGDKLHIVIHQPYKNREVLAPFTNAESQCAVLNITPSAVMRFGMDFEGMSFECGIRGQVVYDTYVWEEIMAFEVRNGGWVKYQIPLNPDELHPMVQMMLDTRQVATDPIPAIDTNVATSNVVQAQFGKKG